MSLLFIAMGLPFDTATLNRFENARLPSGGVREHGQQGRSVRGYGTSPSLFGVDVFTSAQGNSEDSAMKDTQTYPLRLAAFAQRGGRAAQPGRPDEYQSVRSHGGGREGLGAADRRPTSQTGRRGLTSEPSTRS